MQMQGRLDFSLLRFPRPKENLIISQLEFLYIVVIVEKNSAQSNIIDLKKINMGHQFMPVIPPGGPGPGHCYHYHNYLSLSS